jgi:hypothetical protein
VGGRIFATLASQKEGYGNLMLTPEQQAEFVRELPEVFLPIHGGWGRMGRPTFASQKPARTCWSALCAQHGCSGGKECSDEEEACSEGAVILLSRQLDPQTTAAQFNEEAHLSRYLY